MIEIFPIENENKLIVRPDDTQKNLCVKVMDRMKGFKYSPSEKVWVSTKDKYTEFLSWLKYENLKHTYSIEDHQKVISEKHKQSELKIFRKEQFDPYVLRDGVKLFPFQEDDIKLAVKRNRNFLFHEPGLGKTLEAISIFSHYYFKHHIEAIFILSELPLMYHWRKEFLTYSKLFTPDDIIMIDNENKLDFRKHLDKKIFIIAHHILQDIVLDLANKNLKKRDGTKSKKSDIRWGKISTDLSLYFKNQNLGLIIDECHRFKNPKSVLTKSVISSINSFDYRTLMSATPFITRFEDLYSQAQILDPGIFPQTYESFKIDISSEIGRTFKIRIPGGGIKEIKAPYDIIKRNPFTIEKYSEVLSNYVLKRRKQDIPELKAKQIVEEIYLQFPKNYRKIYDSIKEYEISVIKGEVLHEDVSQSFPYLTQFLDNPFLLQGKIIEKDTDIQDIYKLKIDNDPKIKYLDAFLDSHINDLETKVVVYDIHPKTLEMLNDRYKDNYKSYALHGESKYTREEKNNIIEKFNDKDSDCKVLFLSFITSSSGLNLNTACNNLVVYSMPNAPMLWKQGMDRIYRVNNVLDAYVFVLLYDRTYDNERFDSIIKRTEFNDKYMNEVLSVKQIYDLLG
jgi:superfamily II DNA or RNA helicase